ncbi:MAG: hypothetical protein NUV88_00770 [Candidatus Kaiserbacteria bacterium]|nr:hypothetical protein [Candidatus Kaiserbacteria bacterium]
MNAAGQLVSNFVTYIINPAILLIFSAGFFLFLWGLVTFIFKLDEGGDHKEGKEHMLWGIIGMFIMVSVGGIMAILNNTFSLQATNPDVNRIQQVLPIANFGVTGR